jgi:Periplasmic protein TonB, links inner and outer membranes
MKAFCISICLLLLPIFVAGQNDVAGASNWQPFSPTNEEFAVEVPVTLSMSAGQDADANRFYSGRLDRTYFFIFSNKVDDLRGANLALGFARANRPGSFEKIAGNQIEKFDFNDDEGFHHRLFYITTKTRAYVFQTAGGYSDEDYAEHFFETLKVNGTALVNRPKPLRADKPRTENPIPATVSNPVLSDPGNQNSSSAVELTVPSGGVGSGMGTGSSQPTEKPSAATPTQSGPTVPLKILSKKRGDYTDLARYYGIQGSVTLRVKFLSDGTIGSVWAQTGLPFGLTKSAINAAKSIQFQPPVKDGQPYSTYRSIVYSFNLY